jgi:hypothetical protein
LGGALSWSGAYVTLGWVFRRQLEELVAAASRIGSVFAVALIAALVTFVVVKYLQRRRVHRTSRIKLALAFKVTQRTDAGGNPSTVLPPKNPAN